MLAASGFSLVSFWFQAEMGTLPPLECLSFASTIQADLLDLCTGIAGGCPEKTSSYYNIIILLAVKGQAKCLGFFHNQEHFLGPY